MEVMFFYKIQYNTALFVKWKFLPIKYGGRRGVILWNTESNPGVESNARQ
jgi:hypothetical protein